MLVAIDHGNKQIKLAAGRTFTSGLRESDVKPPFGEDILKYNGRYYTLSDIRIPYMRDKTGDDRFYILTLFAIAYEIIDNGFFDNSVMPVRLLVGLPPAHYGAQYERFEKYFMRGDIESFQFRGKDFKIVVKEVASFPQAFAAAMPVFSSIVSLPRVIVIDLGGFTADYLLIKKGQADLSVCDTLENGVIHLYNQIIARVNSDLDILLDESDIDAILKEEEHEYNDDVIRIVFDTAGMFVSDFIGRLRERSIDLRNGKTVFVGGGSILLRKHIEASDKVGSPVFIDKISANAKGYELLYNTSIARR